MHVAYILLKNKEIELKEKYMKDGFYPALGTPTDSNGKLSKDSFNKQVELMIEASAQGVLCLGSMGKMATITDKEYPLVAKACCEVVNKRVPTMIGVMDCSVGRILDRIETLKDFDVDGVVTTIPYYSTLNSNEIVNFFLLLAKKSKFPVYIYDLPGVTQVPITTSQLATLIQEPNIAGIKTGNLNLILNLKRNDMLEESKDFSTFYSNLDLFDVAIRSGIRKNLDGMFTCTPYNTKKMYAENRNDDAVDDALQNILKLRNLFLKENVLAAYSYAMELLNCPGNYHADYALPISDKLKQEIVDMMKQIKEI